MSQSTIFHRHVWMFSWNDPVLSNKDKVSYLRTQHHATDGIPSIDCIYILAKNTKNLLRW